MDVRPTGEVTFHEGYLSRKEARRIDQQDGADMPKPARPEITSGMQTYVDLHRHAAVRAELLGHPMMAMRMMLAHAIAGSPLWSVRPDPRSSRSEDITESADGARAEAVFDAARRAALAMLDFSADEPNVSRGNGNDYGVAGLFLRLQALSDEAVLALVPIVMGETLMAGSAAVEVLGAALRTDMAQWWEADAAFFDLIRDREVLTQIVAEVAGETVAQANAAEKTASLKAIIRACLDGAEGRAKVDAWVPRWMRFAPDAYTTRGGVGTVRAHAKVEAARTALADGKVEAVILALPAPDAVEAQPLAA